MSLVVLLAHPDFSQSRANRRLAEGIADQPELELVQLYDLYPDGTVDFARERERLLRATALVFQFPLQWYSSPSLLKEWQDVVLTPIMYGAGGDAAALHGLPLMAVTTTGGPAASYKKGGTAMTITTLFAPLAATARKCGWLWQPPFAVHDIRNLSDDDLAAATSRYRATLAALPRKTAKPLTQLR